MSKVQASIHIDAPKKDVWPALADFGQVANFNPNVKESHLTAEQPNGRGATRHCALTVAGASIEERIVDWHDGESYSVEIYESKRVPVVTDMIGALSVDEDGSGTRVTMSIEYGTKYGPLGSLLDRVAIQAQNTKAIRLVLAGLKHYIETGEEVVSGVRVDTTSVEVAS